MFAVNLIAILRLCKINHLVLCANCSWGRQETDSTVKRKMLAVSIAVQEKAI